MNFIKYFLPVIMFPSLLFTIGAHAKLDFAEVYCTTKNGSWDWLKSSSPISKVFMLSNNTVLKVDSYYPRMIVTGVWKEGQIDNQSINYFLIDGGKEKIAELKNKCKSKVGYKYNFSHPYSYFISSKNYYLFGYLSDSGEYQIDENYLDEYATVFSNFALSISF